VNQQQEAKQINDRERILARYIGVASIKGDNRRLVREFLLGAVWWAMATPAMFYARFGAIDWFAISFTIFLVVLHLLFALGLHFRTKTEYHTEVPLEGGLADRIGAFWLVACGLGPFFGWLCTAILFTETSWRWQYLARGFFAIVLPVVMALPLVRYVRGKAALISGPLLIIITALPILSCWWVVGDLHDGPIISRVAIVRDSNGGKFFCSSLDGKFENVPCESADSIRAGDRLQITWLRHTRRVLSVRRL
jgi:hypothetical protein